MKSNSATRTRGRLRITPKNREGSTRPTITRFVPMQMKRRGVELRLVIDGNPALLKAIERAQLVFVAIKGR